MGNYKTISVKLNGKESFIQDNDGGTKDSWKNTFKEQAASVEKGFGPDDLVALEKNREESGDVEPWLQSNTITKKRNKKLPPVFKVFGFAAVSAALVGITLGFIMLRMFAGIDSNGMETAAQATDTLPSMTTGSVAEQEGANADSALQLSSTSLPSLEAYVIQGGVFSTEQQAEAWQQRFIDAGFPSIIWNNGSDYRIFAGVATNESALGAMSTTMTEANIEPYVRTWQTEAASIELGADTAEWLQPFASQWSKTLAAVNSQSNVTELTSTWEAWLATYPETDNVNIKALHDKAGALVQEMKSTNGNSIQIYLLELWQMYHQIGQE